MTYFVYFIYFYLFVALGKMILTLASLPDAVNALRNAVIKNENIILSKITLSLVYIYTTLVDCFLWPILLYHEQLAFFLSPSKELVVETIENMYRKKGTL